VGVGRDGRGIVAIRCAGLGSVVGTKLKGIHWFPAFFTENEVTRVVDVTGGMFPSFLSTRLTGELMFEKVGMHIWVDSSLDYITLMVIHMKVCSVSPPSIPLQWAEVLIGHS
jgi:hypothetical protein